MASESRYGNTRIVTIFRDFNALRAAIRSHDVIAIDQAWDRCERWLEFIYEKGTKDETR